VIGSHRREVECEHRRDHSRVSSLLALQLLLQLRLESSQPIDRACSPASARSDAWCSSKLRECSSSVAATSGDSPPPKCHGDSLIPVDGGLRG
jgi:hypothetical protein